MAKAKKVTVDMFNQAWIRYTAQSAARGGRTDKGKEERLALWNDFAQEFKCEFGRDIQEIDSVDDALPFTGALREKLAAWALCAAGTTSEFAYLRALAQ